MEQGYAKPHVWNLVAKVLREQVASEREEFGAGWHESTVWDVADRFADRFEQDEGFNRASFLDSCDPTIYARRAEGNVAAAKQWERDNDPHPGSIES